MENKINGIMEICDKLHLECTCAYNEFSDSIETIKFNINNTYYTYNEALVRLKLMQEFENIDRMPIFEIDIADHLSPDLGIEEEYYIFNIGIDIEGIYAGFGTNCGIKKVKDLFIEWDEYYSLDEHLSYLYELCSEWAITDFEKSLGELK